MNNASHVEKSYVDKSELLYRRISSNRCSSKRKPPHYVVEKPSNKIRIISGAFVGGNNPSVYRKEVVGKPECIDKKSSEGIISIKAVDIKAIEIRDYKVDVKITPSDDNPAHAEIVLIPESDKIPRSVLSRMRDQLARKATCIIEPNPLE